MRVASLQVAAGAFCAVAGAQALVVPHRFTSSPFAPLQPHLTLWALALLTAGIALLGVGLLAAAPAVRLVVQLGTATLLLLLASLQVWAHHWPGAAIYALFGLGTLVACGLPAPQPRRPAARAVHVTELLSVVLGTGAVLAGLGLQTQALAATAGALAWPWHGVAFLVGGLALLASERWAARRAALRVGAHLLAAGAFSAYAWGMPLPLRTWTAVVLYGGSGVLLAILPWLGPRLRQGDPSSLRVRLTVALIAAAGVPLAVAVTAIGTAAERTAIAQAAIEQERTAVTVGRLAGDYVRTYRVTMSTVAARADLLAATPDEQRARLRSLVATDVVAFATFEAAGQPIVRSDVGPLAPLAPPLADEIHQTGAAAVVAALSPQLGRPIFVFAAPLRGPTGAVGGFVTAEVEAASVAAALARQGPDHRPGAMLFLVGADGRVLVHPDATLMASFADLTRHPAVAAARADGALMTGRHVVTFGDRLAGYARVPEVDWVVVTERPAAEVLTGVRAGREIAFVVLLLAVALAGAAGAATAGRFVRPLAALGRAAESLTLGDASTPLPRSTIAEVGRLAAVFGTMRERLATRTAQREHAEAAVQDINRRLRGALDELATAQEQVVQRERLGALGEMASGIAHDFNNALSPVVGFSELLLTGPGLLADEATARRYLGLIHTAGRDAAATVRRLSEFYRPRESGEGVAPVDAHRLVEDVIALTQPRWKNQAQGAGRAIRVTTDLARVPAVAGRAEELREVLTNLVFNAVDALPRGGTITLRVRPAPATPGGGVVLEVQDDGVGMPAAVRRRCLEPFFTTKGKGGTGLGLAMVYGIVRRHSGELEIDSAPGGGTTVRLTLPAHAATAPAGNPHTPAAGAVRPLRVLVVDDEPLVREATAAYLIADGHRVRPATGGHEAVGALGTERFDLVVTDRAMPDLSGETVARAATALRTPVILLTGFGDLMAATGERVPGVAWVLAKPVTAATLREAVAAATSETAVHQASVPPALTAPH